MRLESVRALKSEAVASVLEPLLEAAPRKLGLAFAATAMSHTRKATRLFSIGIAPITSGDYKLAIRVQRVSLEDGPEIARLSKMARGEVDVRFVGRIQKRSGAVQQRRHRPLSIGLSVAHVDVTAGSLGGFVRLPRKEEVHVLSNNHVLANENLAAIGDAILQPGPYDGGKPGKDRIATLSHVIKLRRGSSNVVDSALAAVRKDIDFDPRKISGVGALKGILSDGVSTGMRVAKCGRTTGATFGRITAFELDDVTVAYDIGNLGFDSQIEIEGEGDSTFSDGGDSGSLIVGADGGLAVAQLFAGSETGGGNRRGLTYATPIVTVLESFGAKLIY